MDILKRFKNNKSSNCIDKPTIDQADIKNKKGLFLRLCSGLSKTRASFNFNTKGLLFGKKAIDDNVIENIEEQLISADIGIEATDEIIQFIRNTASKTCLQIKDPLNNLIQSKLKEMITCCEQPLIVNESCKPYLILMVGVNGVGKTTTIGKLAKRFQSEGKSVIIAAGDTFRAAAVEQLKAWGRFNHIPVIGDHHSTDSASVIFDSFATAKKRNIDIVIADTAGRLHTKDNLMNELKKIARVLKKIDDKAPHEIMLILDACNGQNAVSQAQIFNKTLPISGITLTKMDGTAKGGVIFSITKKLKLPIRFIGVGESVNDLYPFQVNNFIAALFDNKKISN